ncbi:hypothetical protein Hanom_Chr06g00503121 [Helianthus anomalus]
MCLWILDCSPPITVDSCCLGNHSGLLLFDESHWIVVVRCITMDYCCLMITVDSCCLGNHSGLLLFDESQWIVVVG